MSDTETRALGRAAVLLLVASFARWGWAAVGPEASAPPQEVATELLEESRALAKGEEERRRPLGPVERLDPNTATEEALDRLPGVGVATARAIVRSREVDGPFRSPGDLSRIKGIGPAAVSRMAPHLDFTLVRPTVAAPPRSAGNVSPAAGPSRVDVNRAPPATLETLPGVGPVLAARIVATRSQKPFSSVEDLARVPGIGPAIVARLRPLVIAKP